MKCPACNESWPAKRRETEEKGLQNHLWSKHRLDLIRSHELAKKIIEHTFTEEDKAECNQLPMPIR